MYVEGFIKCEIYVLSREVSKRDRFTALVQSSPLDKYTNRDKHSA